MSRLFDPLQLGSLALPNRIIMAPLTRRRAGDERTPNGMMAEYYRQRAGAGLILSEATSVSPQGVGYQGTPGIWNDAQVEGWRLVTQEVHEAGGLMFLQLWHVGRISDPELLSGELPVAPSAIAADGYVSILRPRRPMLYPVLSRRTKYPASSTTSGAVPNEQRWPGSTAWKFMAQMDTSLISSCRTKPTRGPTVTVAPLKTERGFFSRSSMP